MSRLKSRDVLIMWPGTNFELQGEESISGTFCAL
jgi:hypothetical protein